ncbi:hypothetical protein QWZ13_16305 [Reinekea marina]|nr:hypothetical protein [Reinekea marina]MDN3650470.1 hypothetical protein [Reinekea marina]
MISDISNLSKHLLLNLNERFNFASHDLINSSNIHYTTTPKARILVYTSR